TRRKGRPAEVTVLARRTCPVRRCPGTVPGQVASRQSRNRMKATPHGRSSHVRGLSPDMAPGDVGLAAEPLEQTKDLARLRDVADLEWPGNDGSVAEQPPEQPLLELERLDAREANRGRATANGAVDHEQLLGGDDEAR